MTVNGAAVLGINCDLAFLTIGLGCFGGGAEEPRPRDLVGLTAGRGGLVGLFLMYSDFALILIGGFPLASVLRGMLGGGGGDSKSTAILCAMHSFKGLRLFGRGGLAGERGDDLDGILSGMAGVVVVESIAGELVGVDTVAELIEVDTMGEFVDGSISVSARELFDVTVESLFNMVTAEELTGEFTPAEFEHSSMEEMELELSVVLGGPTAAALQAIF